jgi:hypothetical protein
MTSIWAVLEPIHSNIYGLAFTLFGAILFYLLRARVRLTYGRANNSRNVVFVPNADDDSKSTESEIYVEKFFLKNSGRKVASDVDFVLSSFPTDISIFEPRDSEIKLIEKGHCLVKIPKISPGELVIIDCLYVNRRAAWVSSVKCLECMGREVPFQTVRLFSNWIDVGFLAMAFFGTAFIFQILFAFFSS